MKFQHFSHSKWLIFLPVALFALFSPQPAEASQVGLLVRGYQIDQIPPTKSDIAYPLCASSVEPFINATWDYEPYQQCGWDSFMLHYTGFIQIPEHETIEFFIASDDGGTVKIGTDEFGVWQDQGCSATMSGELQLAAGTQSVDFWVYENGGGTCAMLAWNIDERGWEIVQPEFFTSEPLPSATTSILETTTTEQSTTLTSSSSSLPQTTTTEPSTTTTEMPPSTTTTSIYQPTTTAVLQTTTALPQTTSSIPLPLPQPVAEVVVTTSEPATTTTQEPLPETTLTTFPQATSITIPATTIPVLPPVSVPDAPETTTSIYTAPETDEPLTQQQFVEVLSVLSEATTPDEVQAVVEEILKADLSSDQAEQLVASAEVLTAITGEQAQQLFEQIEPTQLSESMAAVIADTMNNPDVPTEVKEAFEETLNIFGNEGFSTYVPLGSNVNVAVRRTIIAGTTILVAMPSPAPVRRT